MRKKLISFILMLLLCMGANVLFPVMAFDGSTKTDIVNGIFLTTPTNVPNGSNIIFSAYKNNKMVYSDIYTYADESVIPFFIKNNAEYDSAKIMVWENTDNLSPLTEAETFEFPEKTPEVEVEQNIKELENVQLICTDETGIDASLQPAASGMLRFKDTNGNTYDINTDNVYMYYNSLGRYGTIKYLLNSDNSMKLISFTVSGTESEISLKKIKSVSLDTIEYFTDDNYSDCSAVTINNPTVIYNNRALKNSSDFVDLLKNDAGFINDSDDVALNYFGTIKYVDDTLGDLLIINTYKSYYMSTAVDTKNYLVTLDGRTDKVYIPINDRENYEILKKTALNAEGTAPSSLTIPTKSIVTLSMSYDNSIGTKYIEYLVNSSEKSGTPTEETIPYGPDKKIVKIGNETYRVANDEAASQFEVGSSTTFLTDASGAIVYVTSFNSGNKRFGFLMNATMIDNETLRAKFYDPESQSEFTVLIQNYDDIEFVAEHKNTGTLFWMNIDSASKVKKGNIKLAKDVTMVDDSNLTADVIYVQGNTIKKSSNSTYILTGATTESYSATDGAVFERPDDLTQNGLSYQLLPMQTGVAYSNPEIYQIKRNSKTYTYVIADKFKGLTDTSNIYVVKEEPSIEKRAGENRYYEVSCYNFKTGTEFSSPLKILTSVCDDLRFKAGDIFTYYDDTDTDGIDIDKTDNIYILLRASELASDKTKAKDLKILTSDQNASVYTNGFRTFGIYKENLESTYNSLTLQVPIYVDREYSGVYFARGAGSNAVRPENLKTYVHGDDITSVVYYLFNSGERWGSDIVGEFGSDVTWSEIKSNVKVYIYDDGMPDGEKLTVYKAPSNSDENYEVDVILDSIITLQDLDNSSAEAFEENLHSASLTYTYVTSSASGGTLKALYIIR